MTQILIRMDDELARQVKRIVSEKYGGKRGALSLVVEQAIRQAIFPPSDISVSTLLEIIDYVSRATKDGQSKDQILTNVFLMLDREFEQSIVKGMEDMKAGRTRKVPKGEDAVAFLRKLAEKI